MELIQAHNLAHFSVNADLLGFLQCQDNQLIPQTHFSLETFEHRESIFSLLTYVQQGEHRTPLLSMQIWLA